MKWYGLVFATALYFHSFAASAQTAVTPQPATIEQGLAQLKSHQPQQALATFQQVLQANPNDVATNLYAAGAALDLYQGELAVKYAEKARQLDPDNWKVHTTLVVAYAVAGRATQRDAERELLRKLHADPKAPDAMQSNGFLIDMFPVKQYRIEAVEYFQPLGKFHIYYRFLIRNQQSKRVWTISAESNDFDEKSWEQAHAQQVADGDRQFQMVGEVERRYSLWDQPGKIAVTGYLTRARLGNFADAVALAAQTGATPDLSLVRTYTSKTGITANLEQQIMPGVGLFARAGYTPGQLEAYAFTDVDATAAAGTSLSGSLWGRTGDTLGLAGVVNTISKEHQAYLAAGGLTALIGDGMLPHPGPEKILEAYYQIPIQAWQLTFDYQFIVNPAYNTDRGPASVISARLHAEF